MGKCKYAICVCLAAISLVCCKTVTEEGVPFSLATQRADLLSDVHYSLGFDLTKEAGQVPSYDTLSFRASRRADVILDFKVPEANLLNVNANGKDIEVIFANEHLTIPRKYINRGDNTLIISFVAGEQSLNRREDFLYTLLVPDRARTLFPCFDQPDIKAEFKLTLDVPGSWIAVSNTEAVSKEDKGDHSLYSFASTKPLSTYLFSFVAGRFETVDGIRGDRKISMYHRETDPARVAQSIDIINLVFDSMEWLEEYTGIGYPFDKYDFVVIPDFQYGGMEHAGATLYNDRRIFLSGNPTTEELMERASLIAHETAHMWFGDYVTMRWFDDVWTKEVFANWFAYRMVRPLFPSINYTLSDLKDLYAPAYEEDRTRGNNAIWRPLDNLQDAGLIYCNIIYDKAPVVMDKLAEILGEQAFREGLIEYLKTYGYANASWDELVDILDRRTETHLRKWSDVWIKEAGMPIYSGSVTDGRLEISQTDPYGRDIVWQQDLRHEIAEGRYWIPNTDGRGYGWFKPDAGSLDYIMEHWAGYDDTRRMSLLMTLYENSWHGTLDRKSFIDWCGRNALSERNPLILSSLISYAADEELRCEGGSLEFATCLRSIAADPSRTHEFRLIAFRQYFKSARTEAQWEELYSIWRTGQAFHALELSERDFTDLACQLMIAFPDRYGEIAEIQSGRITNPDRKDTFEMLCLAASPDPDVRNALFASFIGSARNRRPESRVLSALALLCHRQRQEEAMAHIVPSLDVLEEIQRTGDIFFPSSWCRVLLKNQQNAAAARTVDEWLSTHPDINPLLATKILQALKPTSDTAYAYPQAEYHKAESILMYTPGTELFDGVIHPDAGLFDRYFDIDKASDEHRNYISMLESQGCTVHTVTNTLLSMPHSRLASLAEASLSYDVSSLPRRDREAQASYKRQVLDSMSSSDLVRIIINRPTVKLRKSGINTGFEAQYVHNPLMNMYFLRDQSITTPRGHILCRMNSSQRGPEVDIIEACYEQLGEPAFYRIKGKDSYLEGGDYIPFGTISLIGQGLRTNQKAIDELLENDCFVHDTVVVVRDQWQDQYQMHLDTYFNVIDKDLCTMCFNRYDAKGANDVNYLTMDMYVRPAGQKAYHPIPACSGKGFREFLQSRGVTIIRIGKEDADHYANNFLAVDARHIMSVAGQSKALEAEYERNGVKVEWVPLDNLIGGYGAAHCMTQVLRRSNPDNR